MMQKITLYIGRQLVLSFLFITLGLAAILWLSQSLRFVRLIVEKGSSVWIFIKLTLLLMPSFLVILIPVAVFIAVLFVYNRLQADRELIAMRASGLGQWILAKPAVLVAAVMTLVGYLLTLYLIPASYREFREMEYVIRNNLSALLVQEGGFSKEIPGLMIYAKDRDGDGAFRQIMVYDSRNAEQPATMMAERGVVLSGDQRLPVDTVTTTEPKHTSPDDGVQILMLNGNRQTVDAQGRMSILYFERYVVNIAGTQTSGGTRFRDPRERSLGELTSISKQSTPDTEFRQLRVEAFQRFSSPLFSLSYALIALACLLRGGFSRYGQNRNIALGVIIMVALQAAYLGAVHLAAKSLIFVALMYSVAIVPGIISAWFIFFNADMLMRERKAVGLDSNTGIDRNASKT